MSRLLEGGVFNQPLGKQFVMMKLVNVEEQRRKRGEEGEYTVSGVVVYLGRRRRGTE